MKKLFIFSMILVFGFISSCNNNTPFDSKETDLSIQKKLEKTQTDIYRFSAYYPLNPRIHGIRTYKWTFGGGGQYTGQIVGIETIPYKKGEITGVKIQEDGEDRNISMVYYSDRYYFYFFKYGDYFFSSDCDLTSPPSNMRIGFIYDGLIIDFSKDPLYLVKDDFTECIPLTDAIALFEIQDVCISGNIYKDAIIWWALDKNKPYTQLDFYGKEQELNLTFPTASKTNNFALTEFRIYGYKNGILAHGGIHSSTGKLDNLAELVSISYY